MSSTSSGTSQKSVAHAVGIEANFVVLLNFGRIQSALVQIGIDFRSPFEIVADHGVDVAELQ